MDTQHINPAGLLNYPPLSQVVLCRGGRTAYIAGQSTYNHRFELTGGDDLYLQAVQALQNVKTAVEAVGGTVQHIVSSTVHLKIRQPRDSEAFMRALATPLDGQPFPAHAFSVIGVEALSAPKLLVEISAVAVLPD